MNNSQNFDYVVTIDNPTNPPEGAKLKHLVTYYGPDIQVDRHYKETIMKIEAGWNLAKQSSKLIFKFRDRHVAEVFSTFFEGTLEFHD